MGHKMENGIAVFNTIAEKGKVHHNDDRHTMACWEEGGGEEV